MPSATAPPALPDELVEEILLRLDDAADLARASAACASFRRVVTDRRFLRRFRSLHPPPVLGLLDTTGRNRGFYQAQPPRRSAPAARAFAQAADFSFSFLPDPGRWGVCDVCDGRVLLARSVRLPYASWFVFDKLVVYDPLDRRCVEIPPIPADLAPMQPQFEPFLVPIMQFEPFLVPTGEEEESPLRVICNVVYKKSYTTLLRRHYAHCCFYWTTYSNSKGRQKTIVEAGKDKLGLLVLNGRIAEGYILLRGTPLDGNRVRMFPKKNPDILYVTVEVKTLLVERLCVLKFEICPDYLYARFLPPFPSPSMRSVVIEQRQSATSV
ncbi:hypothetical protein ACP70R_029673 [Stipagrostis hirtigluma subsp. patula]